MFLRMSIATLAMAGLISASPAFASGKNQDPSAAPKERPAAGAKTRYCVMTEPATGSIRQGRICKTAEEWRADGVDVTKLPHRD